MAACVFTIWPAPYLFSGVSRWRDSLPSSASRVHLRVARVAFPLTWCESWFSPEFVVSSTASHALFFVPPVRMVKIVIRSVFICFGTTTRWDSLPGSPFNDRWGASFKYVRGATVYRVVGPESHKVFPRCASWSWRSRALRPMVTLVVLKRRSAGSCWFRVPVRVPFGSVLLRRWRGGHHCSIRFSFSICMRLVSILYAESLPFWFF